MKPYPPVYVCPWCLDDTDHPLDILSSNCRCCGSDVMGIIRPCEHRSGSTLHDLFKQGVRLVRREPWADGNYLELRDVGGLLEPFALLHSLLERATVPEHVRIAAQTIPLWRLPRSGWEAYTGQRVDDETGGGTMSAHRDPDGWVVVHKTMDDMPAPTCDFCGAGPMPRPARAYPAREFTLAIVAPGYGERVQEFAGDGWLACAICWPSIERGDLVGLMIAFLREHPEAASHEESLALTTHIFELFFKHRNGPGIEHDPDQGPPVFPLTPEAP